MSMQNGVGSSPKGSLVFASEYCAQSVSELVSAYAKALGLKDVERRLLTMHLAWMFHYHRLIARGVLVDRAEQSEGYGPLLVSANYINLHYPMMAEGILNLCGCTSLTDFALLDSLPVKTHPVKTSRFRLEIGGKCRG